VALGPRHVVLKLSAKGAVVLEAGQPALWVPAFKVTAVDSTAAGDAFNGAFAVALAEGKRAVDAVRFACAAAAISVTRRGAGPSMPNRAEIEALLAGPLAPVTTLTE
jgi:ribokinase